MQVKRNFNFLYSPNFSYFLELDLKMQCFFIVNNGELAKPMRLRIPSNMLNLKNSRNGQHAQQIRSIASRFKFESEHNFRIITNEGIDCLVSFRDGETLKIDAYSKRQNY